MPAEPEWMSVRLRRLLLFELLDSAREGLGRLKTPLFRIAFWFSLVSQCIVRHSADELIVILSEVGGLYISTLL
jgi:hypothetical protein